MHNDQLEKLYDELHEKFLDQEEEIDRLRALAQQWEQHAKEMDAQAGHDARRANAAEDLNRELVEALGKIAGTEVSTCHRCEGNGLLWADGMAHPALYQGRTVPCGECGGTGNVVNTSVEEIIEIAAAALAKARKEG